MTDKITFTLDGVEIEAEAGETILVAAEKAGVYIPRLCSMKGLTPHGSCRVCTVKVNGRPQSACTQPVAPGTVVENDTAEMKDVRISIIDMLFVEGNHYCMFCERSGNCELQAMAYRLGIPAPQHEYQFPNRAQDGSHPAVFIDQDRCILCGRCVRAARELDGKNVFEFVGRGMARKISVNADAKLADTDLEGVDKAVSACPVGAIIKKGKGFKIPVGQRLYDTKPIGSQVEDARTDAEK